jgi:hypothetical protein
MTFEEVEELYKSMLTEKQQEKIHRLERIISQTERNCSIEIQRLTKENNELKYKYNTILEQNEMLNKEIM